MFNKNTTLPELVAYNHLLELVEHIELEEVKLFPYIERLLQAAKVSKFSNEKVGVLDDYSSAQFIDEHDDDPEHRLQEIREAIVKYHPRVQNLMSFRVLLNQLDAFEKDLTIHALIEDKVLIPKVQLLEKELGV